jgi:hypothetical protein
MPPVINPSVVDYFTAQRSVLVAADSRLGSATVLPTAYHQIRIITRFRRHATGRPRVDLLSTEARWAEFLGWLNDDLGDYSTGTHWLDLAMSMSQESNDEAFISYVLARRAQRAVGSSDEDRVVGLSQASARTGGAPPLVRAFAALQAARGHALAGQQAQFQRSVDDAQSLVTATDQDADALGGFCTPAYVHAEEAEGWLHLGDARAAVECFQRALTDWSDEFPRERGLCLARAARAHLVAGDPDHAAVIAQQALTYAVGTRSARIRERVNTVAAETARQSASAQVQDLLCSLARAA